MIVINTNGRHASDLHLQTSSGVQTVQPVLWSMHFQEHITPILMPAPLGAVEARILRKCMPPVSTPSTPAPTPASLPDLLQLYSPSRPLHPTTDTRLPQLPPCRCKMEGGRAFPHSGPSVWNSLPVHVGNVAINDTFVSAVKPYPSTPNFLNHSIRV